jgi:hypothetical protein
LIVAALGRFVKCGYPDFRRDCGFPSGNDDKGGRETGCTGRKRFSCGSKWESGYDKLFWGNNLPVVTPPGEFYVPAWSDEELAELHRILSDGMRLIRVAVRETS